jgi:hypothetical protein
VIPAEISYLDKRCGSFNSHDNIAGRVQRLACRHIDHRGILLDAPKRIRTGLITLITGKAQRPKPLTPHVSKSWYPFDKSPFLLQEPPPRRFPEGYDSRNDYLLRSPEREFEHFEVRRWLPTPKQREWRKPSCEECIWYAALAALTETGNEWQNEFRITAGACRTRGGDRTQAHDEPQRVFATGSAREAGA